MFAPAASFDAISRLVIFSGRYLILRLQFRRRSFDKIACYLMDSKSGRNVGYINEVITVFSKAAVLLAHFLVQISWLGHVRRCLATITGYIAHLKMWLVAKMAEIGSHYMKLLICVFIAARVWNNARHSSSALTEINGRMLCLSPLWRKLYDCYECDIIDIAWFVL